MKNMAQGFKFAKKIGAKKMKKYLVCPGHVHSFNDGQLHYISSRQLISLYKVDIEECVINSNLNPKNPNGLIMLKPKADGNYTIPEEN